MVAIKSNDIEVFFNKLPPSLCAALFHGNDEGVMKRHILTLILRLGVEKDPFNPVFLEDPFEDDILWEELFSSPMFGGRRIVWLKTTATAPSKGMQNLLKRSSFPGFLIVEAPILSKTSSLRNLFEGSPIACSVAFYEETPQEMAQFVRSLFAKEHLKIESDALEDFLSLLGAKTALVEKEVEKLVLYCSDRTLVTRQDIFELCAESALLSLESLIDVVFLGDWSSLTHILGRARQQDLLGERLFYMLCSRVSHLKSLRSKVDRGQSLQEVIRSEKPPIFFQRHRVFQRMVSLWSLEACLEAETRLFSDRAFLRECPALEVEISERTLFALCQKAAFLYVEKEGR